MTSEMLFTVCFGIQHIALLEELQMMHKEHENEA